MRVFSGGVQDELPFLHDRKTGLFRTIDAADILNQLYSLPERDTLTNVVFMGQGERWTIWITCLRATEILTADYGYAWSP